MNDMFHIKRTGGYYYIDAKPSGYLCKDLEVRRFANGNFNSGPNTVDMTTSYHTTKEEAEETIKKYIEKEKEKMNTNLKAGFTYSFNYNGGTHPGKRRYVYVHNVMNDVYYCSDLEINELRNFTKSRISNVQVFIHNEVPLPGLSKEKCNEVANLYIKDGKIATTIANGIIYGTLFKLIFKDLVVGDKFKLFSNKSDYYIKINEINQYTAMSHNGIGYSIDDNCVVEKL